MLPLEGADEESKVRSEVTVNPLVYYQKPAIGNEGTDDVPPVQIIFPTGGFGIGLAGKNSEGVGSEQRPTQQYGTLASPPNYSNLDLAEKQAIATGFLVVAVINIILTSLMFHYAKDVDLSKVQAAVSPLQGVFQRIPLHRRPIEVINFSFTIILLVLGVVSVITESTIGLSGYALGICLNFILGTSSLPYFAYALRYLLDVYMLYLGLVYRSRLMCAFLPLHLHGQ